MSSVDTHTLSKNIMPKKPTLLHQLGETFPPDSEKAAAIARGACSGSRLRSDLHRGNRRGERNVAVINLCRIAKVLKVKPSKLLEGVYYHGE